MFEKLRELFHGRARERYGTEQDVSPDVNQSRVRPTGGVRHGETPADAHSTTAPSEHDVFVGRAEGQDPGYLDTGAERRAEKRQSEQDNDEEGT